MACTNPACGLMSVETRAEKTVPISSRASLTAGVANDPDREWKRLHWVQAANLMFFLFSLPVHFPGEFEDGYSLDQAPYREGGFCLWERSLHERNGFDFFSCLQRMH